MNYEILPFDHVISDATSGNNKVPKANYSDNGKFPIVDQGQNLFGGFTDDEKLTVKNPLPSIIFGDHTRIFKFIETKFCLGADGVKILEPKLDVNKKFLFYYLSSLPIPSLGYSRHYKALKKFNIPLPSLPEQARIAAILDQTDKIRQKRRRAAALADEFLRSVFLEMFGDPVTNPKGWELSRLGEECLVGTGSTPSRDNPQNFLGNIPWVKSTEVNWCVIHDTSEKLSVEAIKNTRLKIYPKNSIILALYGQGITRGKVAILGIEAALNQACAAITPMPNLNQYFLFSFLKYSYENLRQQARGGNQENLNLNIVKNYPIFIPSIELQSKWEKIYIDVENQIQRSDKQQKQLDNLFHSLSQQFFAGSAGGSPAVCP